MTALVPLAVLLAVIFVSKPRKQASVSAVAFPKKQEGKRRLQVRFAVKVAGWEKLAVDVDDVRQTVEKNATALPGKGRPRITVNDVDGGFWVLAIYPDSAGDISAAEAKKKIEAIDNRLQGRVSNVTVKRDK